MQNSDESEPLCFQITIFYLLFVLDEEIILSQKSILFLNAELVG